MAAVMLAGLAAAIPATAAPARGVAAWADSIARAAMATGLVPGMSVAIVADHRMVWAAGYGDADRSRGRKVTTATAFYIASTTKAMTALAAARMAARGQLDLDAPLTRALPGAAFPPGVSGDSIRVRDLATHTHGIDGEGPVSLRVAYTGEYTNDDLLRVLAAHKPAKNGRAFSYSNLGYDLLAIVMAPRGRDGWKEIVEREVLKPLGMNATTPWRSRVSDDALAMPYELGRDSLEEVRLSKEDANMGPAGGLFSTAPDLGRLVLAELDGGRLDGKQVIERSVTSETQRLQAVQDRQAGPYHRYGWGLGWDLATCGSDTLLTRSGNYAGYNCHVSFMPHGGIGVVVLVNGGGAAAPIPDAVATAIYDRWAGGDSAQARFAGRLASAVERGVRGRAAVAADRDRRAARSHVLPLPLERYAGTFVNATYGTLSLRVTDGHLEAVMGVARCPVEVFDATKSQLRLELFGRGDVATAILGEDGRSVVAIELLEASFMRR
jgi:CubicO group peptidase (beta-lactamase class C family)